LQKIHHLTAELERKDVEIMDLKKFTKFKIEQTAVTLQEVITALEQKIKNRTQEHLQLLGKMEELEKIKKPKKRAAVVER